MRFGTTVLITRGGTTPSPGSPGCLREVKGVLIGARGHDRLMRLLKDDPLDTVGWNKTGDVGHWGSSSVPAYDSRRQLPFTLLT